MASFAVLTNKVLTEKPHAAATKSCFSASPSQVQNIFFQPATKNQRLQWEFSSKSQKFSLPRPSANLWQKNWVRGRERGGPRGGKWFPETAQLCHRITLRSHAGATAAALKNGTRCQQERRRQTQRARLISPPPQRAALEFRHANVSHAEERKRGRNLDDLETWQSVLHSPPQKQPLSRDPHVTLTFIKPAHQQGA